MTPGRGRPVHLISLSVLDFRNIAAATVDFDADGTTVITGPNGAGKTNLLEADGYLGTLRSFRGAPREAMVRQGATTAIVRAEVETGPRSVTIEAELPTEGRARTMVNRQAVRRRSDLHDALRCTVFSPHDITIVQGGPSDRRRFLDETLVVVDPQAGPGGRGRRSHPPPTGRPAQERGPATRTLSRQLRSWSGISAWMMPAPPGGGSRTTARATGSSPSRPVRTAERPIAGPFGQVRAIVERTPGRRPGLASSRWTWLVGSPPSVRIVTTSSS